MKSSLLKLLLPAAAFIAAALPLHAGVDSMINLSLKCYVQDKVSVSGNWETGNANILRVDSKLLLQLIAKEVHVNFPNNAQLKLLADGNVYVVDGKSNVIADASPYLQISQALDTRAFDGRRNTVTGQENSHNYFPVTLTLSLPTLQGTISGITAETFSVTEPNRYGIQTSRSASNTAVNGSGTVSDKTAYFDGSLKLIGKGAGMTGRGPA